MTKFDPTAFLGAVLASLSTFSLALATSPFAILTA
jgi:hypothetical protein